jgi:pSer/pThr/pTyr-binding forkhead associated (FHA) protein
MPETPAAQATEAPASAQTHTPMVSSAQHLALRFIAGKYQGGEVPLRDGQELVVGRSSEVDIILVEEMVSRRHARIYCHERGILVEDFGSTNGTFVNGEKISQAALKIGDRILIGTSILKIVLSEGAPASSRITATEATVPRAQSRLMSGAIEEIPLPDLLQLLGTSKKTGTLVVRSGEQTGRVYLNQGVVVGAALDGLGEAPPLKCLFRILTWNDGRFDFGPPDERTIPVSISMAVQEVLMEGVRQADEILVARQALPDPHATFGIPQPLQAPLRDLFAAELDTLQAAHNFGQLDAILDRSPRTDLDTMKTMLRLVEGGYLQAV